MGSLKLDTKTLNDKELIESYKERAEKAEKELELEKDKVDELMKKLKRCKAELSVINCFKSFENSNKTKNKDTETVVLWFKRPWF
jgi:hypothetical protein